MERFVNRTYNEAIEELKEQELIDEETEEQAKEQSNIDKMAREMQVVENVKSHLEQNIYNTLIPRNIRLAEAPSYGMPITKYDPKSAGAEAYRQLANEVINKKGE